MKTTVAILLLCALCGCESFRTVEQQILSAAATATATNTLEIVP